MSHDLVSPAEYRVLLRHNLATFIERSFGELNPQTEFIPGRYIELLAAALDKCRTGETKRLIINLPPRTLKSHAASVAFTAWLLGHDPTVQILCASYGQDLADKFARDTRTLMSGDFYRWLFPGTTLSQSRQAVNDFMTTQNGFRMATSVGGVVTGRGADVIILDDILKPEDALSETRRKAANDWFFSTALGRLNSKEHGVVIVVMQRLHQGDLVGELTDREHCEVLSLPAIAIDDERYPYSDLAGEHVFTRKAGEALHPERDSVEIYQKIREAVGEYNFQSQYQQSPMSREGGIVKREWLKFYDPAKFSTDYWRIIQSWDTACKTGVANDYSVCTTWKLIGENYYLADLFRGRLTYPELKLKALELFNKFQPQRVYIEDQASGMALIQELKNEGMYCVEAYRPEPGSDKVARFHGHSMKFEQGLVWLPNGVAWLNDYIAEITNFPGSKHDDQVDSTSQALEMLAPYARIMGPSSGLVAPYFSPRVYETS